MTAPELILKKLMQHNGEWVNLIDLHHLSSGKPVQWSIALLEKTHRIECKVNKIGKMNHTFYRINSNPEQPEFFGG